MLKDYFHTKFPLEIYHAALLVSAFFFTHFHTDASNQKLIRIFYKDNYVLSSFFIWPCMVEHSTTLIKMHSLKQTPLAMQTGSCHLKKSFGEKAF